jgi:hypothetical protein
VSHEVIPASAGPARATPRLALAFYSVALLLTALATLGVFNPGGYVVVSVLFDHPFLFGVAVLAALGVACWVGPGLVAVRATGLVLAAVAGFGYATFGALNWMAGSPQHEVVSQRGPAGQLEFRVIQGRQVIDTVWELRVRRPGGLLSKEWSAGCLNGDDPDDGFVAVKWIDPESVAVSVADGRVLRVDLDPATGRPLRPVVTGAGC